jgi:carboxymethylenebutenolidase
MGHPVSLSTPTGRITAWRADPPIPPHGAIVVVQEIFGVNSHIRHVVDRFAAHGWVAIAPALFDHIEPHIELAYDEAGVARGRDLAAQVGFDRVMGDIEAAARELETTTDSGKVGVVGYCWGTVPFLGHEHPKAPLLMHFGETDPLIPPEHVALHREHLPQAHIEVWPAGHGFNCEQRADYHEPSAQAALQRTLAFFTRTLR